MRLYQRGRHNRRHLLRVSVQKRGYPARSVCTLCPAAAWSRDVASPSPSIPLHLSRKWHKWAVVDLRPRFKPVPSQLLRYLGVDSFERDPPEERDVMKVALRCWGLSGELSSVGWRAGCYDRQTTTFSSSPRSRLHISKGCSQGGVGSVHRAVVPA